MFRFRPLADSEVLDQVKHVASVEKVTLEEDAAEALAKNAQGD